MYPTFFDGVDELCHHAKFGDDRRMRAGCRCKNVLFVFFVCHAVSPQHRAFEWCIVRTSIVFAFVDRFGRGFQRFLPHVIVVSQAVHSCYIRR